MFAARLRDENAIHDQQTAAASKPLNAGIKGLAPKTPAKTPFKSNKNDENATQAGGKTGGKGGKLERSAFVTPANPKTRAPLGNKTTNAKALKTPLLDVPQKDNSEQASNKPTSPRLRRSKIKVHETIESAEDVLAKDPEEREIEYMAPRGVPLNDDPDDFWPEQLDLDVLRGENRTRGWWGEYNMNRKEPNDEDSELSDFEEKRKKLKASEEKAAKKPITRAAPTTMKAQNAAAALGSSKTTTKSSAPRFAAPTAAAKARQPTSTVRANPRFAAAKAASNTTLGYSKGRAVSATTLSSLHSKPAEPEKKITYLDELLGLGDMGLTDESDDFFSVPARAVDEEDDEEVFQLDPVEDL